MGFLKFVGWLIFWIIVIAIIISMLDKLSLYFATQEIETLLSSLS